MRDIIEQARRTGSARHTDNAYFIRDRGLEYSFRRLEDGTVVGYTDFNPGCLRQHYVIPAGAEDSLCRFEVLNASFNFKVGDTPRFLRDVVGREGSW